MKQALFHWRNLTSVFIVFYSYSTCYGQYGLLRRGKINAGNSMGLGSDHYYNNYPYLAKHEIHGTPYIEVAISKRQMVGIQWSVGNRYFKPEEAIQHFRNTQHPPSYAKTLTRGDHVLYDIGLRHSFFYQLKTKKYHPKVFLRSTLSTGAHQTSSSGFGFIEFRPDTSLAPVRFGTRRTKTW